MLVEGILISILLSWAGIVSTSSYKDNNDHDTITFLMISQSMDNHNKKANILEENILQQCLDINIKCYVHITNRDLGNLIGHWTILPLLPKLSTIENTPSSWYIILEEDSVVDVKKLYTYLLSLDHTTNQFIGHGLSDESLTIIHHFYGYDHSTNDIFYYPDFAAGTVLSQELVKRLVAKLATEKLSSFAIDSKHELARFIFEHLDIRMTPKNDYFCLSAKGDCMIHYSFHWPVESPRSLIKTKDVFFAVKTFSDYHTTRLVVIKRTWAKDLPLVNFFSDISDSLADTINLGVNNTDRGHCGKTFAIMSYFLKRAELKNIRWLLIADDDTLLSIPRLLSLMSIYNPENKMILGERYGYGFSASQDSGYNYPTGGAGMIFSRPAVESILSTCGCPADNSPDDMIIGMCARSADIPVIHSSAFHQARSIDYSSKYLSRMPIISLHKFEDMDAYLEYTTHLEVKPGEMSHNVNSESHVEL